MVRKTLVASCLATGCGYLYFKNTIDEEFKSVYEKFWTFKKDHPRFVVAGSLVSTVFVLKAVAPYLNEAWSYVNGGMELINMAKQIERTAAEKDSECMSRHYQQWRQYALKTALQMNIECRKKIEEHYNIVEIRAQLKEKKEKLPKDKKVEAWNKLKIATFTILFVNHFQTVFVWLKTRLIFSICFRRDYQNFKQDQTLTGPQMRSTDNNDQQRFLNCLKFPEGDDKLLAVVENCVSEVLGKRPLGDKFTEQSYIDILTNIFTLVKRNIFEAPKTRPQEFLIAPLVERDQPTMADLAEMEGELHMILDNPDSINVLNKVLATTLDKITAEARKVFCSSKKEKNDQIFLANLIITTRTLTKTIVPIIDVDSLDPENIMDPLSRALESNGFDDFYNVVSNIK